MERMLGFDAVYSPMTIQVSWIKPIDRTSQPLLELRELLGKGIRPFLLKGVRYSGIAIDGPAAQSDFSEILGLPELMKFKVRFLDEGDEEYRLFQPGASDNKQKPFGGPVRSGLPAIPALSRMRQRRLKALFPVTLWRAGQLSAFKKAASEAINLGISAWQLDQALCNAVGSRDICGAPHFRTVNANNWPKALLERLQKRFEVADGDSSSLTAITAEELSEQVRLDGIALLDLYRFARKGSDLPSVLHALKLGGFV
jgi:hypothetical protein